MTYANRCSFRKTWESTERDGYTDRPEVELWHHSLMCGGAISVQHRLTGYGYGQWDEETGYRSPCGQFWLASGGWDIRDHLHEFDSEEGMIQWVIKRANNCTGGHYAGEKYGRTLAQLEANENWRPAATRAAA